MILDVDKTTWNVCILFIPTLIKHWLYKFGTLESCNAYLDSTSSPIRILKDQAQFGASNYMHPRSWGFSVISDFKMAWIMNMARGSVWSAWQLIICICYPMLKLIFTTVNCFCHYKKQHKHVFLTITFLDVFYLKGKLSIAYFYWNWS